MRVMLSAMRDRGWPFSKAWPNAIQRLRRQPYMSEEDAADLIDWKRILNQHRPIYQAAYEAGAQMADEGAESLSGALRGERDSASGMTPERPTGTARRRLRASQSVAAEPI